MHIILFRWRGLRLNELFRVVFLLLTLISIIICGSLRWYGDVHVPLKTVSGLSLAPSILVQHKWYYQDIWLDFGSRDPWFNSQTQKIILCNNLSNLRQVGTLHLLRATKPLISMGYGVDT